MSKKKANDYRTSFMMDGKRYHIRASSRDELLVKVALKKKEISEGKVILSKNTLLNDWAMECINTYKTGQKEVTRKKYISRVRHCILEPIGNMQLKNVKPLHCQQVLNMQAGKSKHQINQVYQALNFIFEKAVENQLILTNPAQNIIKPIGTKGSRRSITETERKHIVEVASNNRKYYFFLLMLFCGCRPSEAAEAMGKDISIIDGFPMLHIRGTKTALADRFVPVPEYLYNIVKNTPKTEYIACYSTGNKIEYGNRSRVWESFKRELNISMGCKTYRNALVPPYPVAPDLVPYCLRHTYCTDLARKGVDLRVAQKLMGHSTITLTADIYTHVDNNDLVNAAKKLDCVTHASNSL